MPSPQHPHPERQPLSQDVRGGLTYAVGFSILAVVMIIGAAIQNATGARRVVGWSQLPIGLPLVIAGYFTAGVLGGVAFWALRPARRWLLGWMATGFVIAALTYGAIGLTGVLGYYVGANILNLDSAADGWRLLPWFSVITGAFPEIPLGIYYWNKNRTR